MSWEPSVITVPTDAEAYGLALFMRFSFFARFSRHTSGLDGAKNGM